MARCDTGVGTALSLRKLDKQFADDVVVRDVTVHVAHGAVVGLVGRTRAAAEAVASMASGILPPDEGDVLVLGEDVFGPRGGAVRARIGRSSDQALSGVRATARDALVASAVLRGAGPRIAGRRAGVLLAECGLHGVADRPLGDLPLDVHSRLRLAAALLGDPAVLVLDEPFAGTTPESAAVVRRVLAGFAATGGAVLCLDGTGAVDTGWCDQVVHVGTDPVGPGPWSLPVTGTPPRSSSAPATLAACG